MEPIFDKLWSMVTIAMGALVSFFMYRQKKIDEGVEALDKRMDAIEIQQAGYNKSVDYLIKRFDRMEKKFDRLTDDK